MRKIVLAAGTVAVVMSTAVGSVAPYKAVPRPVAPVQQGYRIELPPLGRITGPEPVRESKLKRTVVPVATPSPKRTAKTAPKSGEAVTRISGYTYCGSAVASAQRCIDAGRLTLYYPAGVRTLAGHNYMGWAWMDDLPVGRKVVISSGSLAGTYQVYGHGWAKRGSQGGTFPAAGLGASVALQTCTSSGTGFSFLRRA